MQGNHFSAFRASATPTVSLPPTLNGKQIQNEAPLVFLSCDHNHNKIFGVLVHFLNVNRGVKVFHIEKCQDRELERV